MAGIIKDLIVVGPGELGYRVAMFWKRAHPEAKVYLKTRSDKKERSECWRGAGFLPASTYDDVSPAPYVVFSAPPTGKGRLAPQFNLHEIGQLCQYKVSHVARDLRWINISVRQGRGGVVMEILSILIEVIPI